MVVKKFTVLQFLTYSTGNKDKIFGSLCCCALYLSAMVGYKPEFVNNAVITFAYLIPYLTFEYFTPSTSCGIVTI